MFLPTIKPPKREKGATPFPRLISAGAPVKAANCLESNSASLNPLTAGFNINLLMEISEQSLDSCAHCFLLIFLLIFLRGSAQTSGFNRQAPKRHSHPGDQPSPRRYAQQFARILSLTHPLLLLTPSPAVGAAVHGYEHGIKICSK